MSATRAKAAIVVAIGSALASAIALACGTVLTADGDGVVSAKDASTPVTDGAVVDGPATDGGAAEGGPSCDLSKPFGTAVPLMELGTGEREGTPHLTADELHIVFTRGLSSFIAHRTKVSDPFGMPTVITGIDGGGEDNDPMTSRDGKWLFFTSTRAGGGDYSVYRASKRVVGLPAEFESPVAVGGTQSPDLEFHPFYDERREGIYFTRSIAGATASRIYLSTGDATAGDGGFGTGDVVVDLAAGGGTIESDLPRATTA